MLEGFFKGLRAMGTLRFLLAFSVMAWHLRPAGYRRLTLLDGGLAVIGFFIISGFYMSMVISEKYSKMPHGQVRFFVNRFLRIFPLYFVVLLLQQLVFAVLGVETVFTSELGYSAPTRLALIVMNVLKFGQDYWQTLAEHIQTNVHRGTSDALQTMSDNFFGAKAFEYQPGALLIGQGWSLGSELTYYLLAPLIAVAGWRLLSVFGAGSLVIRLVFMLTLGSAYMGSWRTKFFPAMLVFFIMGHLSWRLYERIQHWRFKNHAGNLALVAWTALLGYALFHEGALLGRDYDSWQMWAFYIFMTLTIPLLFLKTKASRWDAFAGAFSYPIYLVHPIVIQLVFRYGAENKSLRYVLLVAGALASSWVLILLVERPVERLRSWISSGAFRHAAWRPLERPPACEIISKTL